MGKKKAFPSGPAKQGRAAAKQMAEPELTESDDEVIEDAFALGKNKVSFAGGADEDDIDEEAVYDLSDDESESSDDDEEDEEPDLDEEIERGGKAGRRECSGRRCCRCSTQASCLRMHMFMLEGSICLAVCIRSSPCQQWCAAPKAAVSLQLSITGYWLKPL